MFSLGGMWLFGIFLGIPLLLGFASSAKGFHQFLVRRGVSNKNAVTAAFVGVLLLIGVMSSPLFLHSFGMRALVGISYLFFLYRGGKMIVNYFFGDGSKAEAKENRTEDGGDCKCDHQHGEHDDGGARTDATVVRKDAEADGQPDAHETSTSPHARSVADTRAEIERRIKEAEESGDLK